jgi:hypothetical protein
MWRPDMRAAVRRRIFQSKKPAGGFNRAGPALSDDANMPVICPTCQTLSKMPQIGFAKLKLHLQLASARRK